MINHQATWRPFGRAALVNGAIAVSGAVSKQGGDAAAEQVVRSGW